MTKSQEVQFFQLIKKRQKGFPLAYLTGKKEFWSLNFIVNSDVIIPRPETELVVDLAISISPRTGTIVDIGTGCGAIAVSLAKELPLIRVLATDVSEKALELAQLNAKINKVERIEFFQGSLFAPLKKLKLEKSCDTIVSNPPYVSEKEWETLSPEIIDFEPKKAFVAGTSGLACIVEIVHQVPVYLKPGGYLILEFGAGQQDDALNLFGQEWMDVQIYNDLYGIPRVVKARKR